MKAFPDVGNIHRLPWKLWRELPRGADKSALAKILLHAIRHPGEGKIVNTSLYEEAVLVAEEVLAYERQ
jgi:hypothetical protein